MPEGEKNITVNRKARSQYIILDTLEAGIVLVGSEVKSLRDGKVNLLDSYARILKDEVWLFNSHISPYDQASSFNHEPKRQRKLLLNKSEIRKLAGIVSDKGITLVPLRMYFRRGKVKVELALARGKKLYDKREALAEKDAKRQIERAVRIKG
ncbi:MAG: SsrA-binding protein SmpB [Firmicutes bacterium]|nr:SsrA-binding protein SmpB [Bacillota bacterium]